jgi:hypothetical protein
MISGGHVLLFSGDADADRAFLRDELGVYQPRRSARRFASEAAAVQRFLTTHTSRPADVVAGVTDRAYSWRPRQPTESGWSFAKLVKKR